MPPEATHRILEIGPQIQPLHHREGFRLEYGEDYTAVEWDIHAFRHAIWDVIKGDHPDRVHLHGDKDIDEIGAEPESFDEIVALGTNISSRKGNEYLAKADKLLRQGGILRLGMSADSFYPNFPTDDEWDTNIVLKMGYSLVDVSEHDYHNTLSSDGPPYRVLDDVPASNYRVFTFRKDVLDYDAIDTRAAYELYEGRRPEEEDQKKTQKLSIDSEALKLACEEHAAAAFDAQLDLSTAPTSEYHIEPDGAKFAPLLVEVIDPDIPISIVVMQSLDSARGDLTGRSISFDLVQSTLPNSSPTAVYDALKVQWRNGEYIGGYKIDETKDGLVLADRLVDEKYRGQGIGEMLMTTVEAFVSKKATNEKKPIKVNMELAQLSVIGAFVKKHGFRPATREDEQKLEKILTGDDKLCLGKSTYVYEATVPEADRTSDDWKNSYRVKTTKYIEPEMNQPSVEA